MLTKREIRAGFRLLGLSTESDRKQFRQFEQLDQFRGAPLVDDGMNGGKSFDAAPLISGDDHAELAKNSRRSTGKRKSV